MACGGIIEVDETGQNFWIPEEHLKILTGQDADKCFANTSTIPIFANVFKHVANLFKNNGPNGIYCKKLQKFYFFYIHYYCMIFLYDCCLKLKKM